MQNSFYLHDIGRITMRPPRRQVRADGGVYFVTNVTLSNEADDVIELNLFHDKWPPEIRLAADYADVAATPIGSENAAAIHAMQPTGPA